MAPLSGRKTLQKLSSSGSIQQDLTLQYRILLGLKRGLIAVAIAEDRSGYVVGVKLHTSPQLTAGSRKPIAIPVDLKPRHRGCDTAMRRTAANGRDGWTPGLRWSGGERRGSAVSERRNHRTGAVDPKRTRGALDLIQMPAS